MDKMKHIVFTRKDTAELLEYDFPGYNDDQVVVQTTFSTISCGTEKANITGNTSVNAAAPEEEIPHFPRSCGYCSAGVVVAVGANVKSVAVGDRVAMFSSKHCNYNILPENNVIPLDSKTTDQEAAIGFISTFPLAAVRKVNPGLGESTLVMGLGILGQLAVQFAHAAGAVPVIAADPVKERREMALAHGADYAFDPTEPDFAEKVKAVSRGGVNTAIEVTGVGEGLDKALDCMKKMGRVALLGCTRDKNFTIDYYRKVHFPGIVLLGAHTNARPDVESYPQHFTHRDDILAFLDLCAGGRICVRDMIGEVAAPEDCTDVYHRLISDRNFPVVVQFDWRK